MELIDPFSPANAIERWAAAATQQQINVYLYDNIVLIKNTLETEIAALKAKDVSHDTTLANHESRLVSLESALVATNTHLASLDAEQNQIRTEFNNLSQTVTDTLNLYQTTINLLSTNVTNLNLSDQQQWNEINEIKAQINPALLQQVVDGYAGLLAELKLYVDQKTTANTNFIISIENTLTAQIADLESVVITNDANQTQQRVNLQNSVNSQIGALDSRITTFETQTDLQVQNIRTFTTNEIARVDTRIDHLSTRVTTEVARLDGRIDANTNLINAVNQNSITRDTVNRNEYLALHDTAIAHADDLFAQAVQHSDDADAIQDVKITTNTSHIAALMDSDNRQWDTINNTVASQNNLTQTVNTLNTDFTNFKGAQTTLNTSNATKITNLQVSNGHVGRGIFSGNTLVATAKSGLLGVAILGYQVTPINTVNGIKVYFTKPTTHYGFYHALDGVRQPIPETGYLTLTMNPSQTVQNEYLVQLYQKDTATVRPIIYHIRWNPFANVVVIDCLHSGDLTNIYSENLQWKPV